MKITPFSWWVLIVIICLQGNLSILQGEVVPSGDWLGEISYYYFYTQSQCDGCNFKIVPFFAFSSARCSTKVKMPMLIQVLSQVWRFLYSLNALPCNTNVPYIRGKNPSHIPSIVFYAAPVATQYVTSCCPLNTMRSCTTASAGSKTDSVRNSCPSSSNWALLSIAVMCISMAA